MRAPSPTCTWPASAAEEARTTPSPSTQSCATWQCDMMSAPFPMDVAPPPAAVPPLRYAYSPMRQSGPIRNTEGSPLYLRSCGVAPIVANAWTRLFAPTVVCPIIRTCEWRCTPSQSVAWGPIKQNGPTWTPSPTLQPGSKIALGWILGIQIVLYSPRIPF